MILLTLLYNETHPQRRLEYEYCFQKNLNHPAINKIIVFYDTSLGNAGNTLGQWLQQFPVKIIPVDDRITYSEAFNHANQYHKDQIIILANGDIYFDDTLLLLNKVDFTNTFLSITRDDFIGEGGEGSSDVWIYRSPLSSLGGGLQIGTSYCDQIIAHLAVKNGLQVYNPCYSINCCHHHQSRIRNMLGTHLHNPENSSTKDNMLGMPIKDLKKKLQNKYDINLMHGLSEGGGMIPACYLRPDGTFSKPSTQ